MVQLLAISYLFSVHQTICSQNLSNCIWFGSERPLLYYLAEVEYLGIEYSS